MQADVGGAGDGAYAAALFGAPLRKIAGFSGAQVSAVAAAAAAGHAWAAPAWVHLAWSHQLCDDEAAYVIQAVAEVARFGWRLLPDYQLDLGTGAPPAAAKFLLWFPTAASCVCCASRLFQTITSTWDWCVASVCCAQTQDCCWVMNSSWRPLWRLLP